MELTEYQLEAIQSMLEVLRRDMDALRYKVQQLEYYKADDKHTHTEYERR